LPFQEAINCVDVRFAISYKYEKPSGFPLGAEPIPSGQEFFFCAERNISTTGALPNGFLAAVDSSGQSRISEADNSILDYRLSNPRHRRSAII
jgi:hypothetical protein